MLNKYNESEYDKELRKNGLKAVGIIIILILVFLFLERIPYNAVYDPWYYFFGKTFYCSFFIEFIYCSFGFLFFVLFGSLFAISISKKKKYLKQTIALGVFSIFSFMIAFWLIAKPFVLDLRLVVKKQSLVTESDLSRCRKEIHSSRRSSSVEYKLYTYELENNEKKLNFQKNKSDLYQYKSVDLNFYQYRDLERLKHDVSLKDDSINTKLKVYYLPNTDIVLQYEIIK